MEERANGGFASHSLVTALRAVPSLASIDEASLLAIVGDSANLFWSEGSVVLEEGSRTDGLYVVVSGSVRVLGRDGSELNVLHPGDFFGEFSLLLGTPHQNEVRAAADSELLVVPKRCLDGVLAANPDLARRIRETAEERMQANVEAAPPT